MPAEPTEKAASMVLSEHRRSPEELAALALSIARGEAPQIDPAELERTTALVRTEPGLPWGCTALVWLPIVVLFLLVGVIGWLFWAGAYR